MTDDEWDRVLDVTLTVGDACDPRRAAVLPRRRHGGVIVNNATVLGWRAQDAQAHYAAAKAGVMALTRCSAIEAVAHGIRVNAVSPEPRPAPVPGEGHSSTSCWTELSRGRGVRPGRRAMGGRGNAMVFLASDYSSYLTGEVISVSSQQP